MTKEELRKEIGLVLEEFDRYPEADMKGFIDDIIKCCKKYVETQNKKAVISFLNRALENEY